MMPARWLFANSPIREMFHKKKGGLQECVFEAAAMQQQGAARQFANSEI